jgi:DNA-binding transcriptional ArsR family regulator
LIRLELNIEDHLLIRDELKKIKEDVIKQISNYPNGTVFYYDFSKIKGINTSGVDEIIAKVINHLMENEEDKFLFLTNLNEQFEHRYNIDYSLEILGVGIVEQNHDGEAIFLGDIKERHKEMLKLVYEQKGNTAREIANATGKKLSLISTHLNSYYTQRLVKRREDSILEGGRQFRYEGLF